MNKFLLGLSILLSVVLLGGCGSGSSGSKGSDGAAGAAGADGADGADGSAGLSESLTAATQTGTLAITNSDNDTNVALGILTYSTDLVLAGTDNVTTSYGTKRYKFYESAASGGRDLEMDISPTGSAINMGVLSQSGQAAGLDGAGDMIDPRLKDHDNYTLDLTGYVLQTGKSSSATVNVHALGGSSDNTSKVSYITVCPSNASGDTTASCASWNFYDRGMGAASTSGLLFDNASSYFRVFSDGSGGFKLAHAHAGNLAHGGAVTFPTSKGLNDASATVGLTVSGINAVELNPAGASTGLQIVANTWVGSTDNNTIDSNDNILAALTSCATPGDCNDNISIVNLSAGTTTTHAPSTEVINQIFVMGNSSYNYVAVRNGQDNLTIIHDNGTVFATATQAGTRTGAAVDAVLNSSLKDNVTHVAGALGACGAAHPSGNAVVIGMFMDNGTFETVYLEQDSNVTTETVIYGGAGTMDNTTSRDCAMAWYDDGSIHNSGKIWMAIPDDAAGTIDITFSDDNGSSWNAGQATSDFGDNVSSVDIAIDAYENVPVIAANLQGQILLLKVASSDNLTATTLFQSEISQTGSDDPVHLAIDTNGIYYALSGKSAASDNSTLRIFYDGRN